MLLITVYWEESSSSGQVNSQAGGNAGGVINQGGSGYGTGQTSGSGFGTGHSTSSQYNSSSSHFSSSSSGSQSGSGQTSSSQGSGGQFVSNQGGNGQFVNNQGGNGQFVTSQSGNGQFVSGSQGSSGQFSGSQGSFNGNQGNVGGQNQGQFGTTYFFNTTWTNANGEDLTAAEKEEIKKKLAAALASGTIDQGALTGIAQGAFGEGAQVVKVRNKTIVYDANHNIISQVESSTEYGSLGHEGEPGSSFNV